MMPQEKGKNNFLEKENNLNDYSKREFDIIIFGATGYTGRLICEYFLRQYGLPCINKGEARSDGTVSCVKYAFAAREEKKLIELKKGLADDFNEKIIENIKIVVANVIDALSLRDMCLRTKVLLNVVGPFLKYGESVVRACVESNTHYCDITGELPFVKQMQRLYGKIAQDKKIKIVHFCGFDSIPSDLGTLLVQNESLKKFKLPCSLVRFRFTQICGGMSGGTISSAVNMYKSLNKTEKRKLSDPYYLCEKFVNSKNQIIDLRRTQQPKLKMIHYEDDIGYVAEFIMARVNSKVVRWTNHLLGYMYGSNFCYSEGYAKKSMNMLTAFSTNFFLKYIMKMIFFPPFFWIYSKLFLPKSGSGPSRENLNSGCFHAEIIGELYEKNKKKQIFAMVGSDKGDPGYKETSKMLAECGLALALESNKCPDTYGVLSPASAIGLVLIDRLKNSGMTFEIVESLQKSYKNL